MNYWIVKAGFKAWTPDTTLDPGEQGNWWVTRPPQNWGIGDRLFLWKTSPARKLIGLATISRISRRSNREGKRFFTVTYDTEILRKPPSIDELRFSFRHQLPSFLKAGPSGTFFPLSHEQAGILFDAVARVDLGVRKVWPDAPFVTAGVPDIDDDGPEPTSREGRIQIVEHRRRERDPWIVKQKKAQVMRSTGRLECEVCGFDFKAVYGSFGNGFCAVHHLQPLSRAIAPQETHIQDLAILCSNCHRLTHRRVPPIPIAVLRRRVSASNSGIQLAAQQARRG